jgi:hypothetical protein
VKAFDWGEFLEHHSILSTLDAKHADWLLTEDVSTERSYEPGAVIVREGEEDDSVFLIGSGTAEAVLEDERGQTIQLSLMLPGETFGEMAFFEGMPRSATGYGANADRHRTREAGFDAHLTKPLDKDELARILVSEKRRLAYANPSRESIPASGSTS